MKIPFEGFGDVAAWAGIVLSLVWNLINTYLAFWRDRVHLNLVPKAIKVENLGQPTFVTRAQKDLQFLTLSIQREWQAEAFPCWSITNMGMFDVYIDKIGFCADRCVKPGSNFLIYILRPLLVWGPPSLASHVGEQINLPVKLESRTPLVLAVNDMEAIQAARTNNYRYMFVMTACGVSRTVKADFFLDFFKDRAKHSERQSAAPIYF